MRRGAAASSSSSYRRRRSPEATQFILRETTNILRRHQTAHGTTRDYCNMSRHSIGHHLGGETLSSMSSSAALVTSTTNKSRVIMAAAASTDTKWRSPRVGLGAKHHHLPLLPSIKTLFIVWSVMFFQFSESYRPAGRQTNSIYSSPLSSPPPHSMFRRRNFKKADIFYQTGNSEDTLPVCSPNSVCNKVDTYGTPWVEKQCKCPGNEYQCSTSLHVKDGYTIVDRNRQYKMCEPVKKLKRCRYFRDITWTSINYPGENSTQQLVHCRCPRNSVTYLIKRQEFNTSRGTGHQYSFACSPQTKLRCQRKEPCRLFSVRKKASETPPKNELVNTSSLCQCPHKKKCPRHHLDVGVIPGKVYSDDSVRTYSAYCM